ncbi:MAG: PAS domain-containing protein, partial [Bacteroidetes bacterium]|nr:PAS domain-containing protein [Bacteroidota bacterium]
MSKSANQLDSPNNEINIQEQEEMHRKALLEKIVSAERNASNIRLVVIIVSIALYFLTKTPGTNTILANILVAVITLYGLVIFIFKPFNATTIKTVGGLTYAGDVIFTTLWLSATGCWNSPYYIIYYISIIAVAFRYNTRTVVLTAGLYTLCYIALLMMGNQFYAHVPETLYRCLFIFICGYFSTMITRETYTQTHEKLKLKQLAEELKETEAELRKKTNALKGINDELEMMVDERTQELQESANRFKNLLDSIPLIAWTSTPEGDTSYRNIAFYEFVGDVNFDEGVNAFIHHDDRKKLLEQWEQVKNSGAPMELEYRWKRHDDTYIWMLARVISIRNDKGEIMLWIGTATDINEQKKLLEQKDQFIGVASHE